MKQDNSENQLCANVKKVACDQLSVLFKQREGILKHDTYVWENSEAKVTLYLTSDLNRLACYELELRLSGETCQHLKPYMAVIWSLIDGDKNDAPAILDEIWNGTTLGRFMPSPEWSGSFSREDKNVMILLNHQV